MIIKNWQKVECNKFIFCISRVVFTFISVYFLSKTVIIKQNIFSCSAGIEEDSLEPTEDRRRQSSFDSGLGPSTKTEGSLSSETKTTRKVSHQSSEADSSDAIYCFICDEELGVKLTKGC